MTSIAGVQDKLLGCNTAYELIQCKLEKYKNIKVSYELFTKVRTEGRKGDASWKEEALSKTPSDLTRISTELNNFPEKVKNSVNWFLGKVTLVEDPSLREQIEEYRQKLAKHSDILTIQCFANQYFYCFDVRPPTRTNYNDMFSKADQLVASNRAKLEELDKQRRDLASQIQEAQKMDVDES